MNYVIIYEKISNYQHVVLTIIYDKLNITCNVKFDSLNQYVSCTIQLYVSISESTFTLNRYIHQTRAKWKSVPSDVNYSFYYLKLF